jgi:hypothetical protein
MADTVTGARASTRSLALAVGIGGLAGAVLCTGMVWQTSSAMFTGSTGTSGTWAAGSVAVTDDDAGRAVFDSTQDGLLTAYQTLTRCIKVTYTGSIVSGTQVRLYAAASGALAGQLNLTVDEGTGGAFGDCTGFTATTAGLYSGTLAGFATSASSFATGVTHWAPSVTPETCSYRFTVTVPNTNAAQNGTATGSFTWEARS